MSEQFPPQYLDPAQQDWVRFLQDKIRAYRQTIRSWSAALLNIEGKIAQTLEMFNLWKASGLENPQFLVENVRTIIPSGPKKPANGQVQTLMTFSITAPSWAQRADMFIDMTNYYSYWYVDSDYDPGASIWLNVGGQDMLKRGYQMSPATTTVDVRNTKTITLAVRMQSFGASDQDIELEDCAINIGVIYYPNAIGLPQLDITP